MFSFFRSLNIKSGCRTGNLPAEICEYIKLNEQKIPEGKTAEKTRFVVLDTESTGLNIKKDDLLSVGAVAVNDLKIVFSDSFEAVVRHSGPAVKETVIIHGILPSESENGLDEDIFLKKFLGFIRNDVIVAHHAAFDMALINKSLKRIYNITLKNPVLDTAALYRRLEHFGNSEGLKPEEYSLDRLAEKYRVHTSDRHTAAGDALITAMILLKQLRRSADRGILKLNDLLKTGW
jgi:DNA polymerase III subunit epsilon